MHKYHQGGHRGIAALRRIVAVQAHDNLAGVSSGDYVAMVGGQLMG